jgi:murein DD-endopeptidase MepM/ murein hydrolase activator NlpD
MNKLSKIIITALGVVALAVVLVASRQIYIAFGETQLNNSSDSSIDPEIDKINSDIARKKASIEELQRQQDSYKQAIQAKQQEKADLQNQLAIFDNRLASLQASIDKLKLNIEEVQLEIRKLDLEIVAKENEIKRQKEQIATALSLLYKEGDKSDLEIILMNDNFSEYIDQIKQLKDLNSGISDSLDALKTKQASLKSDREAQTERQNSLTKLQADLIAQQQNLGDERGSKQIVLDQTKNSEAEYQKLLAQAKREQENAAADISNLEKTIRQKLSKSKQFNALDTSGEGFTWPVPKNTITAYFHDPEYPFRNVFEHPAIDIRAGQGTPVRAAASGYVARAKDGGATGYSYIMLVHNDGLSTVYGHVSVISVNEEDYVTQGQVIGMSGGMPGTRGAGRLTTGAHMHFEVRLNGLPVNPLDYLQ